MYNNKDFDNLPWNPLKNKRNIRSLWRPFNEYKEFKYPLKGLSEDMFFNYMCLVYHKDSVLVKDFDNALDRKYKALELLGETMTNGKYPKPITELLEHGNEGADKAIIRFCALQNNQRYTLFVTLGIAYDKLMKQIYDNSDTGDIDADIKKLGDFNKNANELLKSIDSLKKEIFSADAKIASRADEEVLSYARIPGYPELVAAGKLEIR